MIEDGIILIWSGTNASIPSGWSRVTGLDSRFLKGTANATDPNVPGGNATHTHSAAANHSHTMNSHTHTVYCSSAYGSYRGTSSSTENCINRSHTHGNSTSGAVVGGSLSSVAATYGSYSNEPPYRKIIFITPNSSVSKIPNYVIYLYSGTDSETSHYICDGNNSTPNFSDKYLKGAGTGANSDITSTFGSLTNTHTLTHTHSNSSHYHSFSIPASTTGGRSSKEPATYEILKGHAHSGNLGSTTSGISSTAPTLSPTETVEPLYKKLLAIQNRAGNSNRLNMIGLWLGNLSDIPKGWVLCDGTNSTPDMRGYYLKITTSTGSIGGTGGSNTHTHASQNHTHSASGTHNHTKTLTHTAGRERDGSVAYEWVDSLVNGQVYHDVTTSSPTATYANGSTSASSSNNEPEYRTVAFIMLVNPTYTATAKGRIFAGGIAKNASARARIKHSDVTHSLSGQARIKRAGETKTVDVKAYLGLDPANHIVPKRIGKIEFGFNDEYVSDFYGYSELPHVDLGKRRVDIHFFDELTNIKRFALSEGQLDIEIRTDRYVWKILDEVYESYFLELANGSTDESWSGTDVGYNGTNHFAGDSCLFLTSTGSQTTGTLTLSSVDASDYYYFDKLSYVVYVSDEDDFSDFSITLTDGSSNTLVSSPTLVEGWNFIAETLDDLTGFSSFDLSDIDQIEVKYTGTADSYVYVDAIRFTKNLGYPNRVFDEGLQYIPMAWFSGNTALFEIKTACEAEGARFFADEDGNLVFQNRQHFNVNDEYKQSVAGFTFNELTDITYITKAEDLINRVVVKLKPRVIVSTAEVIWTYAFKTFIEASETITIWASFTDPCPNTDVGIIDPVATTDYTANVEEDGSGADGTADIDISISKFATAAKLEITNNGTGDLYITYLQLRGTPAKESSEIKVVVEDADSIIKYGEQPSHESQDGGFTIENKYMASETYAETLGQQLVDWYKEPTRRMELRNRSLPQLQLGDMIGVRHDQLERDYTMRVVGLQNTYSLDGLNQAIICRSVSPFETLDYFEVETSEIGSTDVISP
jgi:hypothetical protein